MTESLIGQNGTVAADLCSGGVHFAFTADAARAASLFEEAGTAARQPGGGMLVREQAGAGGGDFASWGRDEDQLALMRRLKAALDPLGLLNPALLTQDPG
jgi:FAD/FMN-containing dehydrogenase